MMRDLGPDGVQVEAERVLDFWFGMTEEQQFAKDETLDRKIAERFGALRDAVLASGATGWRDAPDTVLAAIILLDQFSRNLHRGHAEAFAGDPLALALTTATIERGWEDAYPPERRVFLYMPLMHSEDGAMQELSVAKFEALGRENNAAFARDHRDAIRRFGRFPGRNVALGRATTSEEQAWMADGHGGW